MGMTVMQGAQEDRSRFDEIGAEGGAEVGMG